MQQQQRNNEQWNATGTTRTMEMNRNNNIAE
jgi:hypothetical protein